MVKEDLIKNYLDALVGVYFSYVNPELYPLDMTVESDWIGFLGLPKYNYSMVFKSREELLGRIKVLAHLSGAEVLKGSTDNISMELIL